MCRVLVVHQDSSVREWLHFVLDQSAHEVELAGDAGEALDRMRSFRPHVVMTSLGLPGMDGGELARAIRAGDGADVFIICFTAYVDDKHHRYALDAGCDTILIAPTARATLERAVADACTRAATRFPR